MEVGTKVRYRKTFLSGEIKPMKGLDINEVGVISTIHEPNENNPEPWCIVVYEHNKGTNKVYAHSALLKHLSIVKD